MPTGYVSKIVGTGVKGIAASYIGDRKSDTTWWREQG
jgi:hypothetical protein